MTSSVEDPGHVGGQVHDVGQVQHERRLGHVHRRAVRGEGVGDRAHGVLVLLQVLGRAGQRRGQGQVVGVVAGTADRAGQHARGDQALLPPDEQLGGGADEAVDGEDPRVVVALGEPLQHRPGVDRRLRVHDEVAGQDHLVEVAGGDPRHGGRDGTGPVGAGEGAVGEGDVGRGRGRTLRRRHDGGRQLTADGDRGQPPRPPAPADEHLGHHQGGAAGRVGREGDGPERDRAGAGQVDVVAHDRVRHDVAPPALGLLEPVLTLGLERQRAPPADQTRAAPDPGQDVGGRRVRDQRQQGPRVVDRHGAGHHGSGQAGGRGTGAGIGRGRHGQQAYDGTRAPPVTAAVRPAPPVTAAVARQVTAAVAAPGDRCRPARRRHQGG